ncbi:hypothetical protein M885DRAFT_549999, partial [Pelagophyceae sp. CCMP2097]
VRFGAHRLDGLVAEAHGGDVRREDAVPCRGGHDEPAPGLSPRRPGDYAGPFAAPTG